jgi:hypothetical protein
MLGRHFEVDMAKKPPIMEAFAKIYSPEAAPVIPTKGAIKPDSFITSIAIFQRLSDL